MKIQNSKFKIPYLNEKGIALVMVLILAMISLAIVSAMLFMVTQGTIISGAQKFYRTAEEASVGAAELSTEYIENRGVFTLLEVGFNSGCNCGNPATFNDNIDNISGVRSDRCDKMCNPTANWQNGAPATNNQTALDPTNTPDFQFVLGVPPATFTVFTKIVDTIKGETELGGLVTGGGSLGGGGVVSSNTGVIPGAQIPYLYRLEVQAQATANPRELSRISVLYAY